MRMVLPRKECATDLVNDIYKPTNNALSVTVSRHPVGWSVVFDEEIEDAAAATLQRPL